VYDFTMPEIRSAAFSMTHDTTAHFHHLSKEIFNAPSRRKSKQQQ
jgi:hypothetical protein